MYAFDGAGNVTKMGSDRYVYDLLSRIDEAQLEVPGTGCGEVDRTWAGVMFELAGGGGAHPISKPHERAE